IVMLYLRDGEYYLENNQLKLILKKERVEDLRNYYEEKNYEIAVSLQGGIILERNSNLYFIKSSTEYPFEEKTKKEYEVNKHYYSTTGYKAIEDFTITRNDGLKEEIKGGENLHFLKINKENILKEDDYIWEYFLLNY
ncbi:MAG: hypothetical protein ACQEQF_12855, partial [Bacillota bacterium]